MNISIQGIKGSYHHQVALNLYGNDVVLRECASFGDIPLQLMNHQSERGIMAIENSIAGAIIPNYNLIDSYNLNIIGEYYLPIQHQLMALNGQTLNDIKEVWSHPMALEQCRHFFRQHPHIKLIEEKDTAEVAKRINDKSIKNVAAVASRLAAQLYGLNIIAEDIQSNQENYTRFFILKDSTIDKNQKDYNKASIKFSLPHQSGSLAHVLNYFHKHNLNLTKIQSLPIIDKPWEYAFFTDIIFDKSSDFEQAMEQMKDDLHNLKILGLYNSHII